MHEMGAAGSIPNKLTIDECKTMAGKHWNADVEKTFNTKKGEDGTISKEMFSAYCKSHHGLIIDSKGNAKKIKRRNNVHTEHYDVDPNFQPKVIKKSADARKRLENGLKDNSIFAGMKDEDMGTIIDALEEEHFEKGETIIEQGKHGDTFHVLIEGSVKILVDGEQVAEKKAPYAFGELSLIYDVERAATIVAQETSVAYKTDRLTFRKTLASQQSSKQVHRCEFLRKAPYFQGFSNHLINQIAEAMKELRLSAGEHVIKEGEVGKSFYIIWAGRVRVTKDKTEVKMLKDGDYFGERALLTGEKRAATCTAVTDSIFLELSKSTFDAMLGPLQALMEAESKRRDQHNEKTIKQASSRKATILKPIISSLSDLKVVRTIGTGTFGRVKFVQHKTTKQYMAMKCMLKAQIHAAHQEHNIMYERNCMAEMNHPFVLKLLGTFQDTDQLYMLLDVVMGGELWSLLYSKNVLARTIIGGIKENHARFYTACTLAGFAHIHSHGYAYRDLKPENLLVDSKGHIRICDFGFAKRLGPGEKTTTLCGTPEYLAPELVLSRGHNRAVDYWALGVFIYELITGNTPFYDNNQSRIFVKIINASKVLNFPSSLRPSIKDLVTKLLDPNPVLRLGMLRGNWEDIKQHVWFKGIDWKALEGSVYSAPWVPSIKSAHDDSNFDTFETTNHIPKFKGDQHVFKDF